MSEEVKVNFGCFGCIGTIVMLTLLWALIFGVTYGGVHHGVTCGSGSQGVVVE